MKVVHCKLGPFDVYVGRPSKWGNPFLLKEKNDRGSTLITYMEWLATQEEFIQEIKTELNGKVLGCWCAPKGGIDMDDELVCHAQILARIANS